MKVQRLIMFLLGILIINDLFVAQNNSPQNLNFYPLQIGNVWFYKWTIDNESDSAFTFEKILGDTILENGQKYFVRKVQEFKNRKRTIPIQTYNEFERIDDNTGIVFKFDIHEPFPNERKIFNLLANKGDTTIVDSHGFLMICTNFENRFVFNKARMQKVFQYPNTESYSFLIDAIGEISYVTGIEGNFSRKNLLSAKISNIFFGDSLSITSVNQSTISNNFTLSQNYPNPFNPSTTIKYSIAPPNLPQGETLRHVTLKVYDMLGRETTTLVNEEKAPGNYEVKFDGSNLSSGVYFYRLLAGSFTETKKFVLMK